VADRDAKGHFIKGNQISKKDFTKEMAQHVANRELYWAIRQCSDIPISELKKLVKSGSIGDESLFTYTAIKKGIEGDFRALQWLWEMALGRAKQQLDMSDDMQPIKIEFVSAKNRTTKISGKVSK